MLTVSELKTKGFGTEEKEFPTAWNNEFKKKDNAVGLIYCG